MRLHRKLLSLLLCACITFSGCASRTITQDPASGRIVSQPGFNQFTPEQEVQLGQEASQQVMREMPLVPESSPVTKYVQQLGQKLAARAPGFKYPYTFRVVNQEDINAFALPGGPIFINLGLIQRADESELAGVMAHEISHVVQRHATNQASKQMIAQLPLAVLGGLVGQGVGGQLAQLGASFGLSSLFLKYSRDAESEADLVGAQIMYDAGFNPYAMAEFFQVLEKEGGSRGPEFLQSHPNPGNRAENVSQAIAKFPKKQYARQDSAAYRNMKEAASSMKAMSAQEVAQYAQRHGGGAAQQASIAPAGGFQRLDHSAFSMSYPSNWQVAGNQNSAVLIAPQGGAQGGAIAYGVLISGYRPQQAQSLDQATQELYQMLRQSNPEISPAGNLQSININGIPARSVRLRSRSPLTTQDGRAVAETDWLVAIPRQDGTVLYMIFISPEQQWEQLAPSYEQMLQSLQVRS